MEAFNLYFLDILKNKYAQFDGRARRKEYWMFVAVYAAIYVVLGIITGIFFAISSTLGSIFYGLIGLVSLAVLVPSLALAVRRLHDTNKSGWFILLSFVPIVSLYLIYLLVIEGDQADNQYGPDPKAGER